MKTPTKKNAPKKTAKRVLKIRTGVKAGGLSIYNHNRGLKV